MGNAAVIEKPAPDVAPPRKQPRLSQNALMLEGAIFQRHVAKVEPGITQDDIRHPTFFANLHKKLHRHDLITVFDNAESWRVELVVESVSPEQVVVKPLKAWSIEPLNLAVIHIDETAYCQHKGTLGFCVCLYKNDQVLIRGHGTSGAAINEYHRTRPRPVAQ